MRRDSTMNRHIIVEQLREEWNTNQIDKLKFLNQNKIDITQDGLDDLDWDELPEPIRKTLIDNRLGMIEIKVEAED